MRGLLAFLTPFFFIFSAFADAPESGILDRAQILPLPISKALERVLHEHRRATQDTIFLITEAKSPENGIDAEAGARLEEWRGSTPRPPNVVVIAVDAEEGNLAIRAGLGLDTTIGAGTDRAKEIRRVYFAPEWKVGNKHRALVLSTLEVLRALESPVVLSGEATDALERAGFSGGWTPEPITAKTSTTWIGFVFAFLVFGFALYRTLAVEIHTTGEGWRRVPVSEVLSRRLRKKAAPPLVTGGGVSGNY